MNILKNPYTAVPSKRLSPGSHQSPDGIRFTAAIRPGPSGTCRLVLFNTRKNTRTEIELTDDFRTGSMYSVFVRGLHADNLAYCYEIDGILYNDPYAGRLVPVLIRGSGENLVSAPSELPRDLVIPKCTKKYHYCDRRMYLLNVRGFTKAPDSGVKAERRGTFAGLSDKIPYLKSLGITTVELMPVCELAPERTGLARRLLSPFAIDTGEKFESPADAGLSNRSIGAKAPAAAFGKTASADFASAGYKFESPADAGLSNRSIGAKAPAAAEQSTLADEPEKPNFWGFGNGYYYAPSARLAVNHLHPELEYSGMIAAFHEAGIEVVQDLWFPESISGEAVTSVLSYLVTVYGIDGFHLFGADLPLRHLCENPVLSDTLLMNSNFPDCGQGQMRNDPSVLSSPAVPVHGTIFLDPGKTAYYNDDYMYLLRRLVKGDDCVLEPFVRRFLSVPTGRGEIRYAACYNSFTLADTVTYSRKHNEANGEDNRDGTDNNASWNCGVEGRSRRKDVRTLRHRLIRNMLLLCLLSEGTPLLYAGDERMNTQNGNNNPYCQDNETGWTDWKKTKEASAVLKFTGDCMRFRDQHAVFRKKTPFRFSDYRGLGYPDASFHGIDAWKADFSGYSHSIGILYCEDYENEPTEKELRTGMRHLLYLGINMYWQDIALGLPHLPAGEKWVRIMDTSLPDPFECNEECGPENIQCRVPPRSIVILETVRDESKVPAAEETGQNVQGHAAQSAEQSNEGRDKTENHTGEGAGAPEDH